MAAAETPELAEDRARIRALAVIGIDKTRLSQLSQRYIQTYSNPAPSHVSLKSPPLFLPLHKKSPQLSLLPLSPRESPRVLLSR